MGVECIVAHYVGVNGHCRTERNETKPNETSLCNVTVPYCALLAERTVLLKDIGNLFFEVYYTCTCILTRTVALGSLPLLLNTTLASNLLCVHVFLNFLSLY